MATDTISIDAAGFSSALQELASRVESESDRVIRKSCTDLYRKIVTRTPVDTGRAKAGWQLEMNNDSVVIFNNVEYISYLENGHSMQAPAGMVAISLSEFEQHFRNALSEMT